MTSAVDDDGGVSDPDAPVESGVLSATGVAGIWERTPRDTRIGVGVLAVAAIIGGLFLAVGAIYSGGTTHFTKANDPTKLAPVVLAASVQRAFEVGTAADCKSIGSTCENARTTGTDCQPSGGWGCGVFISVGVTSSDIVFDYQVAVDSKNCWTAVETEDPDKYQFVGHLHGCVTDYDRSVASNQDADDDGWADDEG